MCHFSLSLDVAVGLVRKQCLHTPLPTPVASSQPNGQREKPAGSGDRTRGAVSPTKSFALRPGLAMSLVLSLTQGEQNPGMERTTRSGTFFRKPIGLEERGETENAQFFFTLDVAVGLVRKHCLHTPCQHP